MQHCHQLEGYLPKKSSALAISATLLVTPVILLQIVIVSPGTHLEKDKESLSRTIESQFKNQWGLLLDCEQQSLIFLLRHGKMQ